MRPVRSLAVFLAICAVVVLASTTAAATSFDAKPRCDGVRLRSGPSTSYPTKATIDHTTRVTVAAEVAGSRYSTICGGHTYSGTTWAKVIAIDGVPTSEGYGVKALYAAFGLLVAVAPPPTPATTPPATVAPPTIAPPTAPPTIEPTGSLGPSASPAALPSASSQAPTPTSSPAAGSPSPGAAGSSPTLSSPGELIVLVLALTSVFLAGYALGDHHRRNGSIRKVPSSRLDDVLH